MPATSERRTHRFLGAAETRRFLHDYVRKRVGESDVDDVVQTVLVDALASDRVPEDETEMRRWLIGVARHKIADHHRRGGREQPAELPDIETAPAPVEERELARWAEEQAHSTKEAQKTLQWMAREGEGDKLEHIAEEEQLPAARVRQRVSRMRRFMKERWLAELAAVAALALLAFVIWRALRQPSVDIAQDTPPTQPTDLPIKPPPVAPKVAEAGELRKKALEACERGENRVCLDGLDKAKELDPAGDTAPEIQKAREAAEKAEDETQKKIQETIENNPMSPQSEPSAKPPVVPAPTSTPPKKGEPFQEKKAPTKAPSKPSPKSEPDLKGSMLDDGSQSSDLATNEVMTPPSQAPVPPKPTALPPQMPQQAWSSGGTGSSFPQQTKLRKK